MDVKSILEAAGGVSKVAVRLGLKQSAVSMWIRRKRVPAEHVIRVSEITGVARDQIRPDIFYSAPVERA